jgi:N-acetylmuramoyl-L-alanine amidase
MGKSKLVAIDAGHGGINRFGQYTTAPRKMFDHGPSFEFHNGGIFYEGVSNRRIANALAAMLLKEGIPHMMVSHQSLDTPLKRRVAQANAVRAALYVSIHSNASPNHNARGWEVFTSPGKTASDEAATMLYEEMKELFGVEIDYRTVWTDRDPDKEENFYVLRATKMPAILVENLFFDNHQDALKLHLKSTVERMAEAKLRMIKRFL